MKHRHRPVVRDADTAWLTSALRWSREVIQELATEWRKDRVTGLAAEIAFFGILSFFPALLAVTAFLGSLEAVVGAEAASEARREALGFLSTALSAEAEQTISAVRRLFTEDSVGTLTAGLVVALWAASRGFLAVMRALDIAYDLDERRGYVQGRVTAVALALGTVVVGALLLTALAVGPLLGTGRELAETLGLGTGFAVFWDWLRWPFAAVVVAAWITILLHSAPFHRTPWRWDVPGALLTSATWLALTVGLRLYLTVARDANPVFGTLGGALILIVWLYLLAVGLLIGGELNSVLVARYDIHQEAGRRWCLRRQIIRPIHRMFSAGRRRPRES